MAGLTARSATVSRPTAGPNPASTVSHLHENRLAAVDVFAALSLTNTLPIRPGTHGDAVRDVQRRLTGLGFDVTAVVPGSYDAVTEQAVREFQARRRLRVDGVCGAQTWSSLVEAGFRLGDRLLYLRAPMLRGDDVADLQQRLGALGFDAGRTDGIFGPLAAEALARFQRNTGLPTDGICGPDSVSALSRVARTDGDPLTVALVRETDRLRHSARPLRGTRVAVGETGGLGALADTLGRVLSDGGAVVAVFHHPDESAQAASANDFDAHAFVGLALGAGHGCTMSYFATDGFESVGGSRLAALVLAQVPAGMLGSERRAVGMRVAVLRETRMPAVVCEMGPPAEVVQHTPQLVEALAQGLSLWTNAPIDG